MSTARKKTFPIELSARVPRVACALLLIALAGITTQVTAEQDPYESLLQRISDAEASTGSYHPALLEELLSLAESANSFNLHSEAASLLNRAIQIQRINEGLFTPAQLALQFDLIDSYTKAGDWTAANTSMDHLQWLLLEKRIDREESIIENLLRLAGVHLLAIGADLEAEQPTHYRRAEELTYMALQLSERLWGSSDLRRVSLYYSLVKQFFLQSTAIDLGGDTGYALRELAPGSTWVRSERNTQSRYYYAGLRLFDEMQQKLPAGSEHPEQFEAMINLYRADWQLLFDREEAAASYRAAYQALAQTAPDQLADFFARPRVLPVPVFYPSVESALAGRISGASANLEQPAIPGPEALQVQDWFASMPFVAFPDVAPALSPSPADDFNEIRLSIQLNALNPVSRWVRGTYVSRLSVVDHFELSGDAGAPAFDLDLLNPRLHGLHFRPSLLDGAAQSFEGTLIYHTTVIER